MDMSTKTQASMVGTMTAFTTKCKKVITQYKYNIKMKQVIKLVTLNGTSKGIHRAVFT